MTPQRLLLLLLIPYAGWLVLSYEYHFIDGVNLAFHEAGHLFLRPFGQTLQVLGGTLAQLFFPAVCAAHFLRREQPFEAAICGVWLGESAMYWAEYMGDAKEMALPLVGGNIHDWNWLLTRAGLLERCEGIALIAHLLASAWIVACLVAAAKSLKERQGERRSADPTLARSEQAYRERRE